MRFHPTLPTGRSTCSCLLLCLFFFLSLPGQTKAASGDIALSGRNLSTPATSSIRPGGSLTSPENGEGTLTWPQGSLFRFRRQCAGTVSPTGLIFTAGDFSGQIQGSDSALDIAFPVATMRATNCRFHLQILPEVVRLFLLEGQAEVMPTSQPGAIWPLTAGDGLIWRKGVWTTTGWRQTAASARAGVLRFEEVCSHGGIVLVDGELVIMQEDTTQPRRLRPQALVPIGRVVATGPSGEAQLRLESGPTFHLSPGTSLCFEAEEIRLESGYVLVRHPGTIDPGTGTLSAASLSITGPGQVRIEPRSLCDIKHEGDRLLIRVQAGRARVGTSEQAFVAGDRFSVNRSGASAIAYFPVMKPWSAMQALQPAAVTETTSSNQAPQPDPAPPASRPKEPEPEPATDPTTGTTEEEPETVDLQEFIEDFSDD